MNVFDLTVLNLGLLDLLMLMGFAQCCYIIVYLLFRSGRISRGGLPLIYFLNLALLFAVLFAQSQLSKDFVNLELIKYILLSLQPPLCLLLIIQVAQIYKTPAWYHYWVLLLVPASLMMSYAVISNYYDESCANPWRCDAMIYWLGFTNLIAATISLVSVWFNRSVIEGLIAEKNHQERYWLILSLIMMNVAYIAITLFSYGLDSQPQHMDVMTLLFALAIVYLAGTSLFRIYPQAVRIAEFKKPKPQLSIAETAIAETVEDLVYMQKVYQEPTYSRSDLAKECEATEAQVSKVINVHFGQSFPQLMNYHRVEDAKRLLSQTDVAMNVIADEVGFNSLATFNRVFKELVGQSPSQFRDDNS